MMNDNIKQIYVYYLTNKLSNMKNNHFNTIACSCYKRIDKYEWANHLLTENCVGFRLWW